MEQSDQLQKIRHTLAHVLAASVLELFPGSENSIGPAIDNGFYQDFEIKGDLTEKDLPKIEKLMRKKLKEWRSFDKQVVELETVDQVFENNKYKQELAKDFKTEGKVLTLHNSQDKDGNIVFWDLCKGGHVTDPSVDIDPAAFTLDNLAGAYWRGDENNQMLTRIYGLAFESAEELQAFLQQREEAKKRDHRKLGTQLGLFTFSDLVGKGLPMFLPKGNLLRETLSEYITNLKKDLGYSFVHIPHIAKRDLYERSGHMGKYDAMMPTMTDEDGDEYVMKAMNCPHHFELYNSQMHSYRDLPLRYAENTTVYRNEKSGELHGLTRVKSLTQDDTHHFVRHDQIKNELEMIINLMDQVYKKFDFNNYKVEISIRDSENKDKYFGDDDLWSQTESTLIETVKDWGVEYSIEEGEAAFYGPKIDIKVADSLGRMWQLTTIQLDFVQPENFDMTYVDSDGSKVRPAVIHVAILGSVERFLGVLIEHFAGKFPFWLSPEQVRVLPIAEPHHDFANQVNETLLENGIRSGVVTDDSLGKRIRGAKTDLLPYFIVIGDEEVKNKVVTIEGRDDSLNLSIDKLIDKLHSENSL